MTCMYNISICMHVSIALAVARYYKLSVSVSVCIIIEGEMIFFLILMRKKGANSG
jgi:hypothetical protein